MQAISDNSSNLVAKFRNKTFKNTQTFVDTWLFHENYIYLIYPKGKQASQMEKLALDATAYFEKSDTYTRLSARVCIFRYSTAAHVVNSQRTYTLCSWPFKVLSSEALNFNPKVLHQPNIKTNQTPNNRPRLSFPSFQNCDHNS